MFIPAIPIGGLAGYRVLETTEAQQRTALESDAQVARNVSEFESKISSVRSSDDLLADRSLLEVALTAYGLQDEINNSAFIKRVLDEGTENDAAFANRLNDRRWSAFADAFGFGNANSGFEVADFTILVEQKFRPPTVAQSSVTADQLADLRANIGGLTSISDLTSDSSVLDAALGVFGITREFEADSFFTELLTEGTDDASDLARTQTNTDYVAFTDAFSTLADGVVDTVTRLEYETRLAIQRNGVQVDTAANFATADADAQAALADGQTYTPPSNRITTEDLDAFVAALATADAATIANDDTFRSVALTAFGLENETVSAAELQAILEGGGTTLTAPAFSKSNTGFAALALAFERSTSGVAAEATRTELELAVELEIDRRGLESATTDTTPTIEAAELDYFRETYTPQTTIDELLADPRLFEVALTAFGLENENRSTEFWRDILTEDLTSSTAYVNLVSDTRFRDLARALNPGDDGGPAASARFLFETEQRLATNGVSLSTEDLQYLQSNFGIVEDNLDLAIDPRLMDLTLQAFGFEPGEFNATFALRIMISDPTDPRSFLNTLNDPRWDDFASVFGQRQLGNTGLESFRTEVVNRYKDQTFEIRVGEVDQNLRLALDFRRRVSEVATGPTVAQTGWLELLGDEPLRRVVETAFGLPPETAQIDLTQQVELFAARGRSELGANDPSVFLDPQVVDDVIARFLLRSEVAAGASSSTPGFGAISILNNAVAFGQSVSARV